MAFTLLSPLAAPWQSLGLRYLLAPADLPPELSLPGNGIPAPASGRRADSTTSSRSSMPPRAPQAAQRTPHPARHPEQPAGQGATPYSGQPRPAPVPASGPHADAPSGPVGPAAGQRPAPRPVRPPVPPRDISDRAERPGRVWRPLAPALWPDVWQQRLQKTRPGRIVWTYWNLGNDLSGVDTPGRQERSAFFQRLLQALQHPQGSHTFWPVCLPAAVPSAEEAALQANADVFWSGLPRLGARGVVIMGSAAVDAVQLPGGLRPLQHTIHRGHRVWVLWDVDNMLHENQRYGQMLAMLQQAFHPLIYR